MPAKVIYPTQLLTTVNQRVRIALPALNSRTPTQYTVTFTAAAAAGAESLTIAAMTVPLYAGARLTVVGSDPAHVIEVAETAAVGETTLSILPLEEAIADTDTATTYATIFVAGCTDAAPSSQPKTTDATNFLSGAGSEMAVVGTSRTLSFNFNRVVADPGGDAIMQILFNDEYFDREIYAYVERTNGEIFEGAAIATTGSQAGPVQEKITMQVNLQFQGDSFVFTPSPAAVAPMFG